MKRNVDKSASFKDSTRWGYKSYKARWVDGRWFNHIIVQPQVDERFGHFTDTGSHCGWLCSSSDCYKQLIQYQLLSDNSNQSEKFIKRTLIAQYGQHYCWKLLIKSMCFNCHQKINFTQQLYLYIVLERHSSKKAFTSR